MDVIKKVLLKACVTVAPKLTLHAPVHKPTLHTFLVHPATLAMITRVKDPSEWEFAVPAAIIHQRNCIVNGDGSHCEKLLAIDAIVAQSDAS